MRNLSEVDVEKYLKYVDENMLPREEILGQCFICGKELNEVDLPSGPEKKVVCLSDQSYFINEFEELLEMGEIKL